jgi:hypothetical protein
MLDRLVRLDQRRHLSGGLSEMQEKKDQPGQGDMGGQQKPLPGDEAGKGKPGGDIGKKGGSGDVGGEKPAQPGTEKKY